MRNVVMTLALVGMLVLLAGPVQATYLTHSTEGTLFDETYESQVVGAVPTTANIDPNGNSEAWYAYIRDGGYVKTRDASSDVSHDAYQGDQYVMVNRGGGTAAELYGNFTPDIGSGTLTMEFALYLPTNMPAYGFMFWFDNLDSGRSTSLDNRGMEIAHTGSGNAGYYSGGWQDSGLDFILGDWNEVTIDYHLVDGAADSFDLTVNDSTATGLGVVNELTDLSRFALTAGSGTNISVDAIVPEPSTLVLLSMGLVGLLCYAWRKRK